jgi:hypothetical protein
VVRHRRLPQIAAGTIEFAASAGAGSWRSIGRSFSCHPIELELSEAAQGFNSVSRQPDDQIIRLASKENIPIQAARFCSADVALGQKFVSRFGLPVSAPSNRRFRQTTSVASLPPTHSTLPA